MRYEEVKNMKTERLLCFLLLVVCRLKSFVMRWWLGNTVVWVVLIKLENKCLLKC